jgi:hypothetical protein
VLFLQCLDPNPQDRGPCTCRNTCEHLWLTQTQPIPATFDLLHEALLVTRARCHQQLDSKQPTCRPAASFLQPAAGMTGSSMPCQQLLDSASLVTRMQHHQLLQSIEAPLGSRPGECAALQLLLCSWGQLLGMAVLARQGLVGFWPPSITVQAACNAVAALNAAVG